MAGMIRLDSTLHMRKKLTQAYSVGVFVFVAVILLSGYWAYKNLSAGLQKSEQNILGSLQTLQETIKEATYTSPELKTVRYEEESPNQSQRVLAYEVGFNPNFYKGYYEDYFLNRVIIAVRDLEYARERYIFTGEGRTNDPHWLGNNHIFFTSYCGTACQGLYLVDVRNKETWQAVWGYGRDDAGAVWQTHFTDWFGGEFDFEGLVREVASEVSGDEAYLIFKMEDDQGGFLGEKRFLFTGEELKKL